MSQNSIYSLKYLMVTKYRDNDNPKFLWHQRISENVSSAVNRFLQELEKYEQNFQIPYEERMYRLQLAGYELNKAFTEINKDFRQYILKHNPNSTKHSIYCLSYKGVNLQEIAEKEFNFKFIWNKLSNEFDKRKKIEYTYDKFRKICIVGIAMLFSKYGEVPDYMFTSLFYKILITFFSISSVRSYRLGNDILNLKEIELREIKMIQDLYKFSAKKTYIKKKEDKLPTAGEYIQWQQNNISQKEIQTILAEHYNCSVSKIRKDMMKKGVSLKKYARKDTGKNSNPKIPIDLKSKQIILDTLKI